MSESPKSHSSDADELRRLRELLLGDQAERVDELYHRVDDPDKRTGDVAEVLPGAMETVIADPVTQPRIERPLVETIRGAIKRDTESFAEALFPVLGPAIRRAVADALKSLVERINAAIEHSFTLKGLRWRLEAARSGVPFAQIVLRDTMLYAVQEAFLIQPESGLVLAKARRADTLALDEDAFSAMLTAIQAFIQDSLGMPEGDKLRGADLGDRTLWVINGPQAVLACLVIGSPPQQAREQLVNGLENIHARFGNELDRSPEQIANRAGLETLLERMLLGEVAEGSKRSESKRPFMIWGAAALLLLALVGWGAWQTWQLHRQENAIADLLAAEPGYVLTAHDSEGDELHFHGLRDPLAREPEAVLVDGGHDAKGIVFSFRPYQSLDSEIVLDRLRRSVGGEGLDLQLEGNSLVVSGAVTEPQRVVLEHLPALHPVIESVDLSATRLEAQEAVALARRQLEAPGTITIEPVAGRLAVLGTDATWFAEVNSNTGPFGGWMVDYSPMREVLAKRLDVLSESIDGRILMFDRLLEPSAGVRDELDSLAAAAGDLLNLSAALNRPLNLGIDGFADGTGDRERNREIAIGRARLIARELELRGIDASRLAVATGEWRDGRTDPAMRKVELRVVQETVP